MRALRNKSPLFVCAVGKSGSSRAIRHCVFIKKRGRQNSRKPLGNPAFSLREPRPDSASKQEKNKAEKI